MRKNNRNILKAFVVCTLSISGLASFSAYAQQTSASFGDGSVEIGSDNRACTSSLEAHIRYLSSANTMQYCNGSAWINF